MVGVGLGSSVAVWLGSICVVGVSLGKAVPVGVKLGMLVCVGVRLGKDVRVGVEEAIVVFVGVRENLRVGVRVGVGDGFGALVGVRFAIVTAPGTAAGSRVMNPAITSSIIFRVDILSPSTGNTHWNTNALNQYRAGTVLGPAVDLWKDRSNWKKLLAYASTTIKAMQ